MRKYLLLLIFLVAIAFVNAQERISADRPDQTEGATLTPFHYFQAEFGFGAINYDPGDFDIVHPTMLLKYGLCKKFELQLLDQFVSSYEKMTPSTIRTTGFAPLTAGFRVAVCEEKKIIPKTSVIVRLGIPGLASKDLKTDHPPLTILIPMEKSLTEHVGISANIGMSWNGYSSMPFWICSLSSSYDLGKKWDSFLEIFGVAHKNEQSQNGIDAGLGYYLSNNAKFDLSGGFGITDATPKSFFGIGFSFRVH